MSFQIARQYDENQNLLILKPKGELDITSTPEFKKVGEREYEKYKTDILINAEDLIYMDSTGLGAFIYLLKLCKDDNKKIKISKMKKSIRKLFTITQLDNLFVFEGEEND